MSSLYQLLYLPVNKPLTDGCNIINQDGQVFEYEEHSAWDKEKIRVAEPFFVNSAFNRQVIIGAPSPNIKWLQPGNTVKIVDCEPWVYNLAKKKWVTPTTLDHELAAPFVMYIRVKCPCCQTLF